MCVDAGFLPTPSARRATRSGVGYWYSPSLFLPTPSARRATKNPRNYVSRASAISTHALREEGDRSTACSVLQRGQFLPTPSARRATRSGVGYWYSPSLFLPTPSARRATSKVLSGMPARRDFYPRPPRGGRHAASRAAEWPAGISTHALREEGDLYPCTTRRTARISTHALREEGDSRLLPVMPRPSKFLPTPSARRATHSASV